MLIWRREPDGNYQLANTVDVRSPDKPSNPWMLHNVRGLAAWRGDRLISGSEDGDLVAISVPDGRELFDTATTPQPNAASMPCRSWGRSWPWRTAR